MKASTTDYDAGWQTVGGGAVGIPPGGVDGQALVKTSGVDYAVDWELLTTDWSNVTGKPSTFPSTSHDSDHDDRFSLLAHTHAADSWTTITGKPSTFPPDEHDTAHDDRFSLLAHTHTATYAPLEHDTAHDDRFSLLAHTHAAHADSDHDDRFSQLAHVHTPLVVAALANLPAASGVPEGTTYWVTATARWYVRHATARWYCPAFTFTGLSKTTTSAGAD